VSRALNPPLSGEPVQLSAGRARLWIAPVGASLRLLQVNGRDVLDGYGCDEIAAAAQGQVLTPWPNRLADGRYTFAGETLQVALSEPEKGNAIHGLARWASWEVAARPARARLAHVIWPQAGYPFVLAVTIDYELTDTDLTVTTTASNAGERPLPYGVGFHPYITVGTERVDDASLTLPAGARLLADDRGIPTGEVAPVVGSEYDFRTRREIGATKLDTAFTNLERDPEGRAEVSLAGPDGRRVRVWMDRRHGWVMAFTGDGLPEPARRRRSLGLEPMTCPPNAFATGDGLCVLEPGAEHVSAWGIRWEGLPPSG
jgi:aldose 1-epimerase